MQQCIDEEEFIKKSLKNKGDWNHSFDRFKIKDIEKALKINLGKDLK